MSQKPLGARKEAKWFAICTEPSITKTPIGPVQVPVPYQVLIDLSQATATASNVNFNGKPAFLLDQSKMQRCMGDEQGTSGGTKSSTTSMEVKPVAGSGSVKIGGKRVVRHEDACTLNKENCRGKFLACGAPMSPEEASAPKKVRVHLLPRNPLARFGRIVPLDVITTPKGGTLHWKIKGDAKLIDRSGRSCREGNEVFIEGDPKSKKPYIEVNISVTYRHANGSATTHKTIIVPPSTMGKSADAPTLSQLATLADEDTQWSSGGFRVTGESKSLDNLPKNKKEVSIACFIDGTGNQLINHSNIFKMFDSTRRHLGKWPHNAIVIPGYFAGPGAAKTDVPGQGFGTGSREIAERAYRSIADQYIDCLDDDITPQIDIYGFSRGAAIANELAWFIFDRGIKDTDGSNVVEPKTVKVRFLGLFDTVYSMDRPGLDTSTQWHTRSIPPIVAHSALAFAQDETRVFFIPSILKPIGDTKVTKRIFPGVHSDVGGFDGYNPNIMKLTRSWMCQNANAAGAFYLREHIISDAEVKAIINNPELVIASGPNWKSFKTNYIYYEQEREETVNNAWEGAPRLGSIFKTVASHYPTATPFGLMMKAISPRDPMFKNQFHDMHAQRVFPQEIYRLIADDQRPPLPPDMVREKIYLQ